MHLHDAVPKVRLQDLHSLLFQVFGEEDLPGGVGLGFGHPVLPLYDLIDVIPGLVGIRGHEHFHIILFQVPSSQTNQFIQVVHAIFPDLLHPFF